MRNKFLLLLIFISSFMYNIFAQQNERDAIQMAVKDSIKLMQSQSFNNIKSVNGIYINPEFKFSIILPKFYLYEEKYDNNELYAFNSNMGKDSLEAITVVIDEKSNDLNEYNVQTLIEINNNFSLVGKIETEDFTISGLKAKKNSFTVKMLGRKVIINDYIFINNQYTYIITTSTYFENFDLVKARMENSVKTFQIIQ